MKSHTRSGTILYHLVLCHNHNGNENLKKKKIQVNLSLKVISCDFS